jgi:hypothetical protein
MFGFLLGVVFWHFVGFWSFVSSVVLSGPPHSPALQTAKPSVHEAPEARGAAEPDEGIRITQEQCTTLALDREAGYTRLTACPERIGDLPRNPFSGRQDIAINPSDNRFLSADAAER